MARKLNSKQKAIIISALKKDDSIITSDDLKFDDINKIETINDYETIHHDINRFIHDYHFNNLK